MKIKKIKPNNEFMMIELLVATGLIIPILFGLYSALFAQVITATSLAKEVKVQMIMQSEIERMRSISPADIIECKDKTFIPIIKISKALKNVQFKKTVSKSTDNSFFVILSAKYKRKGTDSPLTLKGMIYGEK